jgi:quercetin 2,3-dioxygenase
MACKGICSRYQALKPYIKKKVTFNKAGEGVAISASASNTKSPLDLLLIGGIPLNEPVARYGPFVMNTKEEILQAIEDYRNGKMGNINF